MTTKRRVFLDGNGSSQINVEGLGAYVPTTDLLDVKQKLGTEIQQLKDQVNAMEVDLGIAIKTAETLKNMTALRDQLQNELEEVKALFVDAIGDGWYDGYMERIKDEKNEDDDTCAFNSEDVMHWSERYESKHRYSKSIADIRAKVIRQFAKESAEGCEMPFIEDLAEEWITRQAAKGGE